VSRQDPFRTPVSQRLIVIGTAVVAMGIVLLAIQRTSARQAVAVPPAPEAIVVQADDPIVSEAMVFRTRPGMLAVQPDSRRRPDAHPRTFATYRLLRSYPGAPPRVPHGLTATEFRTNRCNTCHERGGYSQRFGAYAPVNPHPDWVACLQCHTTNDLLVGLPFPQASPDVAGRHCHWGGPARFEETGLDWRPAAWPTVGVRTLGGVPAIPHDLQTRGNCLSCHMGPGSVAEIRTDHPERSNCRQCHVASGSNAPEFVRPASQSAGVVP
jgi:cytochrome c-type protein NapB